MVNVFEELEKVTQVSVDTPTNLGVPNPLSSDQQTLPDTSGSSQLINHEVVTDAPPEQPNTEEVEFSSEADLFNYVVTQAGIEGFTPTKEGVEGIVELLNFTKQQIQNQYSDFDRQDIIDFKEHLANGGDIESFKYIKSLENEYANIQIQDDNIEDHEKIAKWLYTDIQGIDIEDAEVLIEKRKDNGSLLDFVKTGIDVVSQQRQAEIDAEKNRILEENKAIYEQQLAFQREVENAFKTNNFNGVRLDNKVLSEVQKLTTPTNGEIPLQGIVDKFNGSQHTLLNYFAYCLANNLPIEYKPVIAKPSGVSQPVHQMFSRTKPNKENTIESLSELKSVLGL